MPPGTLLRDALRDRREERGRVLPLPLALAAIAFPFLCAWAAATDGEERAVRTPAARGDALDALARTRRVQGPGEGYVDVHGAPAGWERALLERQGYVAPR